MLRLDVIRTKCFKEHVAHPEIHQELMSTKMLDQECHVTRLDRYNGLAWLFVLSHCFVPNNACVLGNGDGNHS